MKSVHKKPIYVMKQQFKMICNGIKIGTFTHQKKTRILSLFTRNRTNILRNI